MGLIFHASGPSVITGGVTLAIGLNDQKDPSALAFSFSTISLGHAAPCSIQAFIFSTSAFASAGFFRGISGFFLFSPSMIFK